MPNKIDRSLTIIAGIWVKDDFSCMLDLVKRIKKCNAHIIAIRFPKYYECILDSRKDVFGRLKEIKKVLEETGLSLMVEVSDTRDVFIVSKYADILLIDTESSQNLPLLREVSKANKPVLLKRGLSMTLSELLKSAKYIEKGGNSNIILCEGGIRTFSSVNSIATLDISAIPVLKEMVNLLIFVDPIYGSDGKESVLSLSKAAVAAGADGLILDVKCGENKLYNDYLNKLNIKEFCYIVEEVKKIAKVLGKKIENSLEVKANEDQIYRTRHKWR
ncbi:N-acetylneuraminate synthase family protein [Hippea sp. KM1]|uniref:N-acetylneuraminate synthase family protein n=1 Tax=Hippea sp. KM1 TaxID=944481 RepID=UPI00046D9131|nr:N-acetylneuraminate synthase family protein [Hippea sp. KM1]